MCQALCWGSRPNPCLLGGHCLVRGSFMQTAQYATWNVYILHKEGQTGRGKTELGASHERSELSLVSGKAGAAASMPLSLLYHQCLDQVRHLTHISRRNDCPTAAPQQVPLGAGNITLATTVTRVSLLWLFQDPFHGGCFCPQSGASTRRSLGTWLSVLWSDHLTAALHSHCHGATSCGCFKESHYYFGASRYFKHIHEVSDRIAPKKESDSSFPTWPLQDTKHSVFLWEVRKATVIFKASVTEALIFSSTALLTVHMRNKLFFDQSRPRDPEEAGLHERCEDYSQQPSARRSNS